jgi:ATP-dependent Clp protease adaptor protein ClpS
MIFPFNSSFNSDDGDQDQDNGSGSDINREINTGTGLIAEKSKLKPKKPPLYKVLLLNDDYTPMEFVVILLMRFFGKSQEQAEQIMLHVHTKGVGVCGVFPREIAETKVRMVTDFANENQHPLQCTMEKE